MTPTPFMDLLRRASRPATALILGLISGCGAEDGSASPKVTVYPVKGLVQLADGKPLMGGTIVFIPSKESTHTAISPIGPDGTYSLQTPGSGEGAAPGEYRVKVEPDYANLPEGKKKGTKAVPFAASFTDEDASGLVATVKAADNALPPFKLDPSKVAAAQSKAPMRD